MVKFKAIALAVVFVSVSSAAFADITYTPVPFDYNSYNWGRDSSYPTGEGVIFGGVPFDIPVYDNYNTWDSNTGSGLKSLTIPLNIYGVQEVHTLINTSWGSSGSQLTWITFTGSEGASYTKTFVDGIDIRDWRSGEYVNTINGTTSVQVWGSYLDMHRIDKQFIELPAEFQGQYLTSISIYDNGSQYSHRAYLYGVTVGNTVPEPVSTALFLLGGMTLAVRRLRRK